MQEQAWLQKYTRILKIHAYFARTSLVTKIHAYFKNTRVFCKNKPGYKNTRVFLQEQAWLQEYTRSIFINFFNIYFTKKHDVMFFQHKLFYIVTKHEVPIFKSSNLPNVQIFHPKHKVPIFRSSNLQIFQTFKSSIHIFYTACI